MMHALWTLLPIVLPPGLTGLVMPKAQTEGLQQKYAELSGCNLAYGHTHPPSSVRSSEIV